MTDVHTHQWAIIGAGPAGIATIGQLTNHGVKASEILWIDPDFQVGDFGKLWSAVTSNTIVKLFTDFLTACPIYHYDQYADQFDLHSLPTNETCLLSHMSNVLQRTTQTLLKQVAHHQGLVKSLARGNGGWTIDCGNNTFFSEKVVIAIGAEPKTLPLATPKVIDLAIALDPSKLKANVKAEDVVAVFGNSHSAVLIIKALVEAGVQCILNFSRTPLKFALNMGNWTLFDNTGLKGNAATWAKEYLLDNPLPQIETIFSNESSLKQHLSQCNKAIYAIGFNRRKITIKNMPEVHYNPRNGIIAPGLFGIGIAFPEQTTDPYGNVEANVGLWKFMTYLEKVIPLWMRYYDGQFSPVKTITTTVL